MRAPLLFAHLLGMVLWLGGGFAAMSLGLALRGRQAPELALLTEAQGRLLRGLILPGVLLTVLSGLLLTLQLYNTPMIAGGLPVPLLVMQGAGLLAAAIVLVVGLPAATRLARLDPVAHAPLFASLRKRSALASSLAGTLGLIALVAAAMLR